jgi:hypothetical protein
VTAEFIGKTVGIENERLQLALEDLIDSQKVVQGQLVTGGEPDEICDSENFEILLRLSRTESVPSFEPLGIKWLPLYLADYQGIANPKDNIDGLYTAMEQLLCYPAEGGIWESEIFPARLHPYDPSWLDTLMQEEALLWVGSGGHHVTFCFEPDLDLLQEDNTEEAELSPDEEDRAEGGILQPGAGRMIDLFPDAAGRHFATLLEFQVDAELAGRLG